MVVAAGANYFGVCDKTTLTVSQALMIKPAHPRFLTFGDRCEVTAIITNNTAAEIRGVCRLTADGLVLKGENVAPVVVPPFSGRVAVPFEVTPSRLGDVVLRFGVVSTPTIGDMVKITIPVVPPCVQLSSGDTFHVDGSEVLAIVPRRESYMAPNFGGVHVSCSSTLLHPLADTIHFLRRYPYECSEQIASRAFASSLYLSFAKRFPSPGIPSETDLRNHIEKDVKTLLDRMSYDGGIGFWKKGDPTYPAVALSVHHFLLHYASTFDQHTSCKEDLALVANLRDKALRYLKEIRKSIQDHEANQDHFWKYSEGEKARMVALAFNLLHRFLPASAYPNLLKEAEDVMRTYSRSNPAPLDVIALLLPILKDTPHDGGKMVRLLTNCIVDTADSAQFVSSIQEYNSSLLLHSDVRENAMAVASAVEVLSDPTTTSRLVRGLMKKKWRNTQDHIWGLLAVLGYAAKYESVTPNYAVEIWVRDSIVSDYTAVPSSASKLEKPKSVLIPLAQLHEGDNEILIAKKGEGRLYVRSELSFVHTDLSKVVPEKEGFVVSRTMTDLNGLHISNIAAGERCLVTVRFLTTQQRYHVACRVPIPAGLEIVRATTYEDRASFSSASSRVQRSWWWDHCNHRDQCFEVFTQSMGPGEYEYSVVAQATRRGEFVAASAKVEEMYTPETYGTTEPVSFNVV
jgi:uncharacterized protein YfaS (alpha-2-macroglobulin family)